LTEWQNDFEALGLKVAAMTYDAVPELAEFGEEREVAYPLLSDQSAKHVDAWGIRNEKYEPGHPAYGIAHPGVFLLDQGGVIQLKRADPDYTERPAFDELLATARTLLASAEQSSSGR